MLKTVAGTQITKIIVKDKNGNTLASDLEKIVCNGNTIYIKQCNLTIRLFYGFSNIDSWTECGTSYERYYPLPLKFKASWGITEKIKSVTLILGRNYSSDCFSNITNTTIITTNGETKEISASRFWSDTDGGYISFALTECLITYFDDTTKSFYIRNTGTNILYFQIKDGLAKNQYTNFSTSITV